MLLGSVRELLFNVVKHAGVRQARVELNRPAADQLQIAVDDRGAGFSLPNSGPPASAHGSGFGLADLRERVTVLGGRLEIHTAPGRGTRVTISMPLRPLT